MKVAEEKSMQAGTSVRMASGFEMNLRRFGVPDNAVAETISVGHGDTAFLTADARESAAAGTALVTSDLDQFKEWLGRHDEECADVALELPEPWRGGTERQYRDLTGAERRTLDIAGNAYLFGDSRRVRGYRRVLEAYRAPFIATVYAAKRVMIDAGAVLAVQGTPAVLLFDELTIHHTGRLVTYTATNAVFGSLRKVGGESGDE